jgi:hypothetical protein
MLKSRWGTRVLHLFTAITISGLLISCGETAASRCKVERNAVLSLTEAISRGCIDYSLSGTGSSGEMVLQVKNRTEIVWTLEIEIGTELKPPKDTVQQMTVVTKVELKLEPHEVETVELDGRVSRYRKASTGQRRYSMDSPTFAVCCKLHRVRQSQYRRRKGIRSATLLRV